MLIKRKHLDSGICFAWLPTETPEGWVWLEWVHWKYHAGEFYSYRRWVPEKEYQTGKRAPGEVREVGPVAHCAPFDGMRYVTPPDPEKCGNRHPDEDTTPCWYPHCACMTGGGSPACNKIFGGHGDV